MANCGWLRCHGRWIDHVSKSHFYMDAMKENPVKYFQKKIISFDINVAVILTEIARNIALLKLVCFCL